MASLKGKVILITGASSGIGAATAVHLAEYQPKLVLAARRVERLNEVAKQCEDNGCLSDQILVVKCDVESDEDLRSLVNKTVEKFKQIDVLVNNAGIGMYKSMMDLSMDDFDKVMRINLRSPFYLCQLCIPYLIQTQGTIINMSSISAQRAFPGVISYCISKAGLDQFTNTLAVELAPKKVRVNSINPGVIITEFQSQAGMTPEQKQAYFEKQKTIQPLGGAGDPVEVAKAVKYLASDESSFITGQILFVDGGRHSIAAV